jgi:hypothetical protein
MARHLRTLPSLTFLPPNLLDAMRQHRLVYTPLLIWYTPARLIPLIHLRLFRPTDQFGGGSVGRNHRSHAAHGGTRPLRPRVVLSVPAKVLLRGHRAPVPTMHVHTVPPLSAESAGFVRPVAHRARQRRVVLVVCEEGESESEKRAGGDVLPVVPVVHRARDGDERCAYKGCKSHQSLGRVAAFVLQGKVRPSRDFR